MRILCIGDIVGKPGRLALETLLGDIKNRSGIDFVVANAENAAGGAGLTSALADQLLALGADVLTLGDHVWDQKDLETYLEISPAVIRPANFPEGAPGKGWCIRTSRTGKRVGVINLLGRTFMRYQVECPFRTFEHLLKEVKKETPIVVVDFHAEATSEKVAFGRFADGKVTAVVGTHTHVQTADEQILPQSTAYITDLGMTGPHDSVIGQDKDNIIKRFVTSLPARFHVAENDIFLNGAIIEVDEATGKAVSITRVKQPLPEKK